MSLYQKYRPKSLDQIKGNKETVLKLQNMLSKKESFPHAVLLYGETGCGKTTIARIIANELGCIGSDLYEYDSSQFRGIDTSRDIHYKSQFLASEGKIRVWILDECHKMTNDAQNALLKILEDTPDHVYFILCTTDPIKLISAVKGRCSQFQVYPISNDEMFSLLRRIVRSEKQELKQEVFDQIILSANGLPRNAIQILEQVLSVPDDERLSIAKVTVERQHQVIELCRALIKRNSWKQVKAILVSIKEEDPENIRRVVLGYMQSVLLGNEDDMAAAIIEAFWEPTYNIGFPGIVYACYSIINLKR